MRCRRVLLTLLATGATAVGTAPAPARSSAIPAAAAQSSMTPAAARTTTTQAAAAQPTPTPSAAQATASPGEARPVYLAEQLRRDPVYVSPSLARVAEPAEVAALRREVAAMPFPTFVVLAPGFTDEPGLETFSELPTVLRDRVGRDGLYLVSDEDTIGFEAEAFGVRPRGNVRRISLIAGDAVPRRDGPIAQIRFALKHLATGATATRSVDEERDAAEDRPWWIFGFCALLGLIVPVGIASATPNARDRRAERRRARDARKRAADAPDPARALAPRAEARRSAQEAVAGLARAIAEAPDPPDAAVRGYDAASHVLSRRGTTALDCLGAETLATAARARLRGERWVPCLFDPRHGAGTTPTRWRRGTEETTIPACASCAADVARGIAPPVLLDRGDPYWERDTVWSRTGFGALDDRLADVVLAGGRSAR